jgi:eukaryotic translation initiation factor 2C
MNVIAEMCGYRDVNSWISEVRSRGMSRQGISKINETLKNTKLKLMHLGYQKKFKMLGPAANHPDSRFELENRQVTVAEYYQQMCRSSPTYRRFLPNGSLRFPHLPTINVGSAKKPVLIPMELINVYNGQNFSSRCTGEMTATLIRHAAVKPEERFHSILDTMTSNGGLLNTIRSDPTAMAFGVSDFELRPMSVAGRLLPPPKLHYKDQQVDPMLNGSWNSPNAVKFAQSPQSPSTDGSYTYGVVVVGKPSKQGWEATVSSYLQQFEQEAKKSSLKFKNGGPVLQSSNRSDELTHHFQRMMTHGARFVIVMLCGEYYCEVKSAADPLGLLTSCLRWRTVEDPSRGKLPNILVKLHAKLGGVNHHISLMKNSIPPFDRLCMLVGIDVSHAAPGSDQPSVAAVVGTVDRQVSFSSLVFLSSSLSRLTPLPPSYSVQATQYVTHLSSQGCRVEIVSALEEAMTQLFTAFRQRNEGKMPEHVVVYRDGVGDGQFDEVLDRELPCIQSALAATVPTLSILFL